MIEGLLIGITFHFAVDRLKYLEKISKNFPKLSKSTRVLVVTNSESDDEHRLIKKSIEIDSEVIVPKFIGHPYLLTWGHFDLFRRYFRSDPEISHFMYLEDDIEVRPENLGYWIRAREDLRQTGVFPSFLRYEIKDGESVKRSTDVTSVLKFAEIPSIPTKNLNYCYINLPQPYQGMYFLDRSLAEEHFFGPSSSPDFGRWNIREKAAQGLTFCNVPKGCFSRNFLGFHRDEGVIDPDALIHHTPNNYANNPNTKFGKIPVNDLIF